MYVALTEQELDALRGTDYSLTVLYLYLKQFIDYGTGIVGYARRVSYQGMSEALYIEPRAGVKGGSPHISSIRRMIEQLVKSRLVQKHRKDTLVFKLPLADTEKYAQNKADRKSTPIADTVETNKQAVSSTKADRPKKAKADTPHLSLNTINISTSSSVCNSVEATAKSDDDAKILYFPKGLHQDTKSAMQNIVKGFEHDKQQELLDELAWYMQKGKVRATPEGLLIAMVNQAKAGAFVAANAHRVKAIRLNPPTETQQSAAPVTQEQRKANQTRGREKMASVHQILKGKKSA